ncbi:hypothetical protein [Leucobacter luti]|uniref:Uncharacterized protein n=1 Tax=Leucobacter luti TaxID=340320 RepID=A0A4R6S0W2_9MICO|nr:hypothetical protein [Leucobacter luti]QYM76307.1 hypothetical protein K1X41_02230 [Leucobacter luti]TDP92597.1 hypothetical protein EDF62_1813 [Leucobacter luti]
MSPQNLQPTRTSPNVWSSRLELNSLGAETPGMEQAQDDSSRPRSSKIEREIIWAVVVLYAGIIACFAGLHIFGLTLG